VPATTYVSLQPLDLRFFLPLNADFSGVTGDLSSVSHSFLVSIDVFKSPKRLLPEGEES